MTTLKAPKITAAQRKELEAHKSNLEETIRDVENHSQKVTELRKKEASLEKKAGELHRRAAAFELDAETELASTLKQIDRVHQAIQEAECRAHDDKAVNFQLIDQAQELVSKIGQATYHELLDKIGEALAPYYGSFNDARYAGRAAPAVNDLVLRVLAHRVAKYDSVERISDAAKDVLRKVNAMLDGSELWSYTPVAR